MAERIMLRLDSFDFEIATAAYQRYVAKQGARWAEQERLGRYPALQFTGQTTPEITLDGVLYPGALGAGTGTRAVSIAPLRMMVSNGKPVPMISGLGDVCGQWVVMDVSDTRTVFLDNGEARKIEFSVSLKYYGPDATGQAGPANYGRASGSGGAGLRGAGSGKAGLAGLGKTGLAGVASGMDERIRALQEVSENSPMSAISAVADVVGAVVQNATTAASAVVNAITGLTSEIINDVENIIPQPVLGVMQDMIKGAETVAALGSFVGDTLSAIKAMEYAGQGDGQTDRQADARVILDSLSRGIRHIADSTQLIGHSATAGMGIIERTETTWDAVNDFSDTPQQTSPVADVCRSATSMISTLSTLCFETSQHAADVRDKIHIADAKPLPPKDEDARREKIFAGLTDGKDRLILCLPEIANAEYGRANALDKIGWAYFHDLITKWLHGKAYVMKDKYDNGGQEPYFVDWNWLMGYQRFARTVQDMLSPVYLFSDLAKAKLASLLELDGAFNGTGTSFNYITLKPKELRAKAFQNKSMDYWLFEVLVPSLSIKPDGLQTMLANTMIFAVASGRTKVEPGGEKTILVTEVAFFIHDGFEFSDDQGLGSWKCKNGEKSFDISGLPLDNKAFRDFRSRVRDYGGDFRIMCIPELVWKGSYSYTVM